ncbi:hypothetical protein FOXB_01731 [Fusarium oxysporum f. sp. conglutinans Fo5176]|uniref:Tc1-like transposase DDE domain-containing protein n=1 Tax=Fusarium oxysporum (strain Fo5176) TaxID=660025 RepID=F9F5Q6_FUSOF|nr:hypothetical protein FOXB_01731 [Fusarium oxysporum f. sp. conglutinans Fo5176]
MSYIINTMSFYDCLSRIVDMHLSLPNNILFLTGTISKTKKRWEEEEILQSKARKGRPKKLTALQIRSKRRIKLLEEDAKARLKHCEFWLHHLDDYIQICFSDEVTVQNAPNNPDGWVFRRPNERYRKDLVNIQSHGKACQSVMFWGAIAGTNRSYIIPIIRDPAAKKGGYSSWSYRKALTEGLLPFLDELKLFQQDNARMHIAKATID